MRIHKRSGVLAVWVLLAFSMAACIFSLPFMRQPSPPPLPTHAPLLTPGPLFSAHIGMGGYWFVLHEAAGDIPALARVRISHAWKDDVGWWYSIVAEDETSIAEVREDQISYLPGIAPGQPTPTAMFDRAIGMGTAFVLTADVGGLSAGTVVRVGSARLDGIGWLYAVSSDDGAYAEAREWQMQPFTDADAPAAG